MSLTAADTFMSDNIADSDIVIDTWEWAEQEHADMICVIYLSDDDVIKHSIHNVAVW